MSIICVYHSADIDGKVSAGIVKMHYKSDYVEFVPSNYGLNTRLNLTPDTTLIIVDFSFDLDVMREMEKQVKKLIWIDHHPVIEQYKEQGYNPEGLRGQEHSAAYYCWKYFFPDKKVPDFVRYTSDYDTWAHTMPESMAFNAAMYNEPMPTINSYDWNRLLDDTYMEYLLNSGRRILEFADIKRRAVKSHIFQTTFMGHKTAAINMRNTNSTIFDDCGIECSIMMTFGKYANLENPRVTIYSTDNTVNVGKLAESLGGGGHAGAAGFTVGWHDLPLCPKADVRLEYHLGEIDSMLKEDRHIHDFYVKECNRVYKSMGSIRQFLGVEVVGINHPLWSDGMTPYRDCDDVVAWSFMGGRYLYRVYAYSQELRNIVMSSHSPTIMPDGGLWFLDDGMLIGMTR